MVHHATDILEGGHHAKIEYNLGVTHANKQMNRRVIELLNLKN